MKRVEVVPFEDMDDATATKHLEARHQSGLDFVFRDGRILGSRNAWDIYHSREHAAGEAGDHEH